MRTAAPVGDGATKTRFTTEHRIPTISAVAGQQPVADLPAFRERLVVARARLVERVIGEFDPERAFPDTAWTRMVADLHVCILAVDDMLKEQQNGN